MICNFFVKNRDRAAGAAPNENPPALGLAPSTSPNENPPYMTEHEFAGKSV